MVPVNSTALVPQAQDDGGICFVRFAPKPPFDERLVLWRERDWRSQLFAALVFVPFALRAAGVK